jgi:hypothetical protein
MVARKKAAAKPRKARVEGAEASVPVVDPYVADFGEAPSDFETKTVEEIEGHPNPVPGDDGDALDRIAESFRTRFPEKWEEMRLYPLQHGISAMADTLRGKG